MKEVIKSIVFISILIALIPVHAQVRLDLGIDQCQTFAADEAGGEEKAEGEKKDGKKKGDKKKGDEEPDCE